MSEHTSSGSYRIELLRSNNWMPWKHRMLAILRDQDLEQYIEKDARYPIAVKPSELTEAEEAKQKQWRNGDVKARTRIALAIRDA